MRIFKWNYKSFVWNYHTHTYKINKKLQKSFFSFLFAWLRDFGIYLPNILRAIFIYFSPYLLIFFSLQTVRNDMFVAWNLSFNHLKDCHYWWKKLSSVIHVVFFSSGRGGCLFYNGGFVPQPLDCNSAFWILFSSGFYFLIFLSQIWTSFWQTFTEDIRF